MRAESPADVVVVTGSSGLIGRAVVRRLAPRFRVVGFDREGWPHPPPEAECVCVDLTSDESVRAGFERVRYAYGARLASVIHLAAYYDFSGEPSPLYEELTVRGTARLLHELQTFEVEQLVFSSTMLVHAPCEPGDRIDEGWPLDPKWDYPRSKAATEELIRREHGKVSAVILRIAGVYDDECHSIPLANQIQRIFERWMTAKVFPGDPSRGQAFVHLDDVTEAFASAVDRRRTLGPDATFLIGEPETLAYDEIQRSLARLIHGEEWETRSIPKALAKAGAWLEDQVPGEEPFIKPWMIDLADDHYALDIGQARRELAWEPKRSLRETLPRMAAALARDPVRFYQENKLEGPSVTRGDGKLEEMTPTRAAAKHPTRPADAAAAYTCPMHPDVRQDQPGTCPKCGMDLVPAQSGHDAPHEEPSADHAAMVRQMRRKWLWTNATVAALGAWLVTMPFTFGYRQPAMVWSDVASGWLLVVLATAAVWPRFDFLGRWGVALVGTWLQFAPLVFWARDPAAYVVDTLVGALAIALSVLVPMMPGMAHHMAMMKPGPEIPPGWTYNPSTWHQRAPLFAIGLAGWFISRHLAAVQLGYIPSAWEPFFGQGTLRVLHSEVSRSWPISDAGLGAAAYTFETLMALMGGRTRWRTMPWMVTFFGILVIPLGVVHIVLVILQPVMVGHWCTLCLAAASLMLAMIPLTVDEVVAMIQFLARARREGKPLWRTFWVGDTIEGGSADQRTPRYGSAIRAMAPAMWWGGTVPRALLASAVLGLWTMFAPAVFGATGAVADSQHVAGALAVTFAAVATAEPMRILRLVNLLIGAWIALTPFAFQGATSAGRWNAVAVGLVLIGLSVRRGTVRERYGSWDRFVV